MANNVSAEFRPSIEGWTSAAVCAAAQYQDLGWQVGTPRLSSDTAHPRSITCCSLRRARWSRILTVVRATPKRSAISGALDVVGLMPRNLSDVCGSVSSHKHAAARLAGFHDSGIECRTDAGAESSWWISRRRGWCARRPRQWKWFLPGSFWHSPSPRIWNGLAALGCSVLGW
jgi:hypothetical protein